MRSKPFIGLLSVGLAFTSLAGERDWLVPKEDATISCEFQKAIPRSPSIMNKILGPKIVEKGTFSITLKAGRQESLVDYTAFFVEYKLTKSLQFKTSGYLMNPNEVTYFFNIQDAEKITLWKTITLNRSTLSGSINHENMIDSPLSCSKSRHQF